MTSKSTKSAALLGALALLAGCGDGSSASSPNETLGSGGLTASGGAGVGGITDGTGSIGAGGSASGGVATGGGATGGASTGGVSTGGGSTGGTSTGGTATGGTINVDDLTPCTPGTENLIKCNGDSDEFKQQSLPPYFVWNNPWSDYSSDGTQCTWYTCSNGSMVGWGTEFNYNANHPNEVKSYAAAVRGWHWSSPGAALGLQVSGDDPILCDWKYTVSVTGQTTMNVAYDLWLHSTSNPSWGENATDEPTDEIMIWLYRTGGAGPISADGNAELTANIAGASWELHEGAIPGAWKVHSFVRTAGSTTGQALDLNDFMQLLVEKGYMPASRYLSGIEAGTEPFRGQGRVDTSSWGCVLP